MLDSVYPGGERMVLAAFAQVRIEDLTARAGFTDFSSGNQKAGEVYASETLAMLNRARCIEADHAEARRCHFRVGSYALSCDLRRNW